MTGAGMMDCKSALTEAEGDIEKAIEILRKKGQKLSVKRADREAKEGVVIAMVSDDRTRGVILKLSSETDFVAKNEDFVNLAKAFAKTALDNFPGTIEDLLNLGYQQITIGEKITEQIGVIGEKNRGCHLRDPGGYYDLSIHSHGQPRCRARRPQHEGRQIL